MHLRAIERSFGIRFWWDERIAAGQVWTDEIRSAISLAKIFVLAVSPDFIASDYIYFHEMPAIRGRRLNGGLVMPVILKPCSWEIITGPIQAIPIETGRLTPVIDWPREDGLDRSREQIRAAIETHLARAARPFDWSERP